MKKEGLSETYKNLYKDIIEELIHVFCNSNANYCVRYKAGSDEVHIAISKKFEEYKNLALINMKGDRLDRHKLAACLCGAIIEVKPIAWYNEAGINKNINEILALYSALNIIKYYMMVDLTLKSDLSLEEQGEARRYLKENYNMIMPNKTENICDTQEYRKNILNALYWSHQKCKYTGKECFKYDLWTYSNIFYHLEKYNETYIKKVFEDYIQS